MAKADGTARHAADEALTKWPAASGYDYDKLKLDPNWEQDESQAVHLLMKPGQFFLFISRCMHGSEPNTSKSSTHYGCSTRFVTTDVRVYADGGDSFHHFGEDLSLERYAAVLVAGEDTACSGNK